MPVSVGSLSDIKQPDIWSDWFAGLADLNEHVPMDLGYLASGYTRPQMEAVTVLGTMWDILPCLYNMNSAMWAVVGWAKPRSQAAISLP